MGLSEVLILVAAVAGFATGYLAAVLRHGDTNVGTPSASHNRQSMPLRCPKCGNLLPTICEACHIVVDNRG